MPTTTEPAGPRPWWKRLAWFVGLWAAGVLAVGSVAYLIRWWIV
jgi:hypothetical protein